MLVERQTVECGGVPCTEYRHEPDLEDLADSPCFGSGEFDGSIGLQPSNPEHQEYYLGWCLGYREYLLTPRELFLEGVNEIPF